MTPQEAIKTLKDVYYEEDYCLVPELAEALEKSIEALERQNPEKPNEDMYGLFFNYYCPACERKLVPYKWDREVHYCHCCGQAIDWSDTE